MGEYTPVYRNGERLDRRTLDNLRRVEERLGVTFMCWQGSYQEGGLSGGTHLGGGALDLNTPADPQKLVKHLRNAGFAAWYRTQADGFDPHIHAIDLGNKKLSDAARWQVTEYWAGGDGLTGSDLDSQPYRPTKDTWYPYTGRLSGFDWNAWRAARTLRQKLSSLASRIRGLRRERRRTKHRLEKLS